MATKKVEKTPELEAAIEAYRAAAVEMKASKDCLDEANARLSQAQTRYNDAADKKRSAEMTLLAAV